MGRAHTIGFLDAGPELINHRGKFIGRPVCKLNNKGSLQALSADDQAASYARVHRHDMMFHRNGIGLLSVQKDNNVIKTSTRAPEIRLCRVSNHQILSMIFIEFGENGKRKLMGLARLAPHNHYFMLLSSNMLHLYPKFWMEVKVAPVRVTISVGAMNDIQKSGFGCTVSINKG